MQQDFACALRDAAPIATLLHTLALEWSAPRQRKGRPVPADAAREVLCDFEGTPCPLFDSPVAFLAGFAAHTHGSVGRALRVRVAHESPAAQRVLSMAINITASGPAVVQQVSEATDVDVLLLQAGSPPPSSAERSRVSIVVAASPSQPLSQQQWNAQLPSLSAAAGVAAAGSSSSSFMFPADDAGAGASRHALSPSSSRRGRPPPNPPALHPAVMLWGTAACGPPPLYDLRRPPGLATPAEASSAAAALAAGATYTEWFTCASLEVLRPVVRNLFRLPRRKGKSVWATCFGREAPREHSPCFWFSGAHFRGEHFVTQVLSSPDMLLSRLSAHRKAARELRRQQQQGASSRAGGGTASATSTSSAAAATDSTSASSWPPLLLVDPAAGEGNYTQHLPDGMGRMPALALVAEHGWHALLGEPEPETHGWLRRNFAPHLASGRVTLVSDGVTAEPNAIVQPLFSIDANVPELASAFPPRGLPPITRQRLQWGSSPEVGTALSVRGDLWLFNHLAGGPILEALEAAGLSERASAFRSCKHNSDKRKARCYNATIVSRNVTLRPWSHLLARLPRVPAPAAASVVPVAAAVAAAAAGATGAAALAPPPPAIDLMVVNQRDPLVGPLLLAFPYGLTKPSLIYFRTSSGSGVRRHLLASGYQTSAHWETSAWGEHTLVWRAERCNASHMWPPPLWSTPAFGASAARAASAALAAASPHRRAASAAGPRGGAGGRRGRRRGGARPRAR